MPVARVVGTASGGWLARPPAQVRRRAPSTWRRSARPSPSTGRATGPTTAGRHRARSATAPCGEGAPVHRLPDARRRDVRRRTADAHGDRRRLGQPGDVHDRVRQHLQRLRHLVLTITGPGVRTITASRAGDDDCAAAERVVRTVTVSSKVETLGGRTSPRRGRGGAYHPHPHRCHRVLAGRVGPGAPRDARGRRRRTGVAGRLPARRQLPLQRGHGRELPLQPGHLRAGAGDAPAAVHGAGRPDRARGHVHDRGEARRGGSAPRSGLVAPVPDLGHPRHEAGLRRPTR